MEVTKGYRTPVEPIVVLVLALLDRFIRRPVQLHSVEERCFLEPVAGDVTRIEWGQVTNQADGAVRVIENQPDGDLALRHVRCRGLVEFLQQCRDHLVLEELGYALGVLDVRLRGALVIGARDRHSCHPNNEARDCNTKVRELIYLHVRAPYFDHRFSYNFDTRSRTADGRPADAERFSNGAPTMDSLS